MFIFSKTNNLTITGIISQKKTKNPTKTKQNKKLGKT